MEKLSKMGRGHKRMKEICRARAKSVVLAWAKVCLLIGCWMMGNVSVMAQTSTYTLEEAQTVSSSVVCLKLKVYGKDKKTIASEATLAALKTALFKGCPQTAFKKPLLDDGEATSCNLHPAYFNDLYANRVGDFIGSCKQTSDFKKADKDKATAFEIEVNVLSLRKDLEKNGIRKKMGL